MLSRSSYKSKAELTLITEKGKEINIPSYYINSIVTDYKFEDAIMPIIYLQLQINIELYNMIVNNAREGKFFFSLRNCLTKVIGRFCTTPSKKCQFYGTK